VVWRLGEPSFAACTGAANGEGDWAGMNVDYQQDPLGGLGNHFSVLSLFADKTNGRPRAFHSQDR
jgi:hypothetical protein